MAKSNTQTALFFNFALLLSFLLIVSVAGSRSLPIGVHEKETLTLQCASVYGVDTGETCFTVAQKFNLNNDFFLSINPNINCGALFVGQWVCVNGFAI